MLVGLGVSVAWKLGRGIEEQPEAFGAVPWVVAAVALLVLGGGTLARRFGRGERVAVVVATLITLAAWGLVQLGPMNRVYELVPAFVVAWLTALSVSRLVPQDDAGPG
jgi:hypothetical protein